MSSLLDKLSGPLSSLKIASRNPPHKAKRQQSWILDCLQTHQVCKPQDTTPFLPTRLMMCNHFSQYAFLTHETSIPTIGGWLLCAIAGNLEAGRRNDHYLKSRGAPAKIFLGKLPKTLRDAVEVTRSLSIPYIWVDALCIVQDDKEDWEREIGTMVQVYSRATATIVAGASDHCDGGFP